MGWKVLGTARVFSAGGTSAPDMVLSEAGCECVNSPQPGPLPEDALIDALSGYDALIASNDQLTGRVFAACPDLKVVSRCGVGVDTVDIGAATAAGIVVTRTPGAMTDAVADFAMAQMLVLARGLHLANAEMHAGGWCAERGVLLAGKTLGLVGYGDIGRATARRAAAFGLTILAHDPPLQAALAGLPSHPSGAREDSVEFVELDDLVARSDFISLHAPGTPQTRGMFDAARLARMKPTAYIVNTARGALIDEGALIEALQNGRIAGAAIDVFQQEPLPADHPLRHAPNCVLTPHNAFLAVEATEAMARRSAENVVTVMRGQQPEGICNPEVWESPSLRLRQ